MKDLLFVGIVAIALAFGSACNPGDIIPDSEDCAKYLQCDTSGNALDSVACPTDQLFNPDINACDTTSECKFLSGCPSSGHTYLPDKNDCTKFTICDDGVPSPGQCPDGRSWDINTESCIPTSTAKCEQVSPVSCPSSGLEFFPNPNDIHSYYRCEDGVPSLESCDPNLVWDDFVKACVAE